MLPNIIKLLNIQYDMIVKYQSSSNFVKFSLHTLCIYINGILILPLHEFIEIISFFLTNHVTITFIMYICRCK